VSWPHHRGSSTIWRTATKRVARKPARKRSASPDATINTLVILVVIVMVLGGLFLYAQNKKQAALWPSIMQAIANLPAPPLAAVVRETEATGSVQPAQPAAQIETPRPETPRPMSALETPRPTSAVETPRPTSALATPQLTSLEPPQHMSAVKTPHPPPTAETPQSAPRKPTAQPGGTNRCTQDHCNDPGAQADGTQWRAWRESHQD
jgi:hypothetical protein